MSSGVKFEGIVGYSRAVKIGTLVFVSGTTGVDYAARSDSDVDAYSQTKRAIENINSALARVGSSLSDVVRTRSSSDPMSIGMTLQGRTAKRLAQSSLPRR